MTTMPIAVPDRLPRALATTREPAEAAARRATLRAEEIELRLAEIELDSLLRRESAVAVPYELLLAIGLALAALVFATSTIARVALVLAIVAAGAAAVMSHRRARTA